MIHLHHKGDHRVEGHRLRCSTEEKDRPLVDEQENVAVEIGKGFESRLTKEMDGILQDRILIFTRMITRLWFRTFESLCIR